jgi:hypothetical protein
VAPTVRHEVDVEQRLIMTALPNYRGKHNRRIVWKPYPAARTAGGMMRARLIFYQVLPEAVEFIESEDSVQVFRFFEIMPIS